MPFPEFQGRLLQLLRYSSSLYEVFSMILLFEIRPCHSEVEDFYKEKIRVLCKELQTSSACDELLDKLKEIQSSSLPLYDHMVRCISIARVKGASASALIREAVCREQVRRGEKKASVSTS